MKSFYLTKPIIWTHLKFISFYGVAIPSFFFAHTKLLNFWSDFRRWQKIRQKEASQNSHLFCLACLRIKAVKCFGKCQYFGACCIFLSGSDEWESKQKTWISAENSQFSTISSRLLRRWRRLKSILRICRLRGFWILSYFEKTKTRKNILFEWARNSTSLRIHYCGGD